LKLEQFNLKFKPATQDARFPVGKKSKLLKLHQTEGRISSLLKRNQSSRKSSIECRRLKFQIKLF